MHDASIGRTSGDLRRDPDAPTTTARRRALITLVSAAVLVTFLVVVGSTQPLDDRWASWMTAIATPVLASLAQGLHVVGGTAGVTITVVVGAVVLGMIGQLRLVPPWFLMATVAMLISTTMKFTVGRARPEVALVEELSFAFPSGHAVAAAAVAIGLASLCGIVWPATRRPGMTGAVAWTVLMAWSRTYLLVHWLSDVVGGALIGATVVAAVMLLFGPRLRARLEPIPLGSVVTVPVSEEPV